MLRDSRPQKSSTRRPRAVFNLSARTKQSFPCPVIKEAGRALLASARRTGGKGIIAAMIAGGAVLGTVSPGRAQGVYVAASQLTNGENTVLDFVNTRNQSLYYSLPSQYISSLLALSPDGRSLYLTTLNNIGVFDTQAV